MDGQIIDRWMDGWTDDRWMDKGVPFFDPVFIYFLPLILQCTEGYEFDHEKQSCKGNSLSPLKFMSAYHMYTVFNYTCTDILEYQHQPFKTHHELAYCIIRTCARYSC